MAAFGSFCLLIALALAAYNLLAGALALRLIATGQLTRISPERLADTARRAGIAGFVAVTGAAFALIWSVFTNDFSITYILEHSNRALPTPTSSRRCGAARKVRCCFGRGCWGCMASFCGCGIRPMSSSMPTRDRFWPGCRCSSCRCWYLPHRRLRCSRDMLPGVRFLPTATGSIPCSSIRRW